MMDWWIQERQIRQKREQKAHQHSERMPMTRTLLWSSSECRQSFTKPTTAAEKRSEDPCVCSQTKCGCKSGLCEVCATVLIVWKRPFGRIP